MLLDLVNSDEFGALKGTKLVAICPFCLILALFTSSKLIEEEALVCISMYPQYLDLDGYKSIWICRVQKYWSHNSSAVRTMRAACIAEIHVARIVCTAEELCDQFF